MHVLATPYNTSRSIRPTVPLHAAAQYSVVVVVVVVVPTARSGRVCILHIHVCVGGYVRTYVGR